MKIKNIMNIISLLSVILLVYLSVHDYIDGKNLVVAINTFLIVFVIRGLKDQWNKNEN